MAGDLFSQTGECEKALSCWDRAYANDSTQISCLFSKAELYASMGRTELIRLLEEKHEVY